MKGFTRILIGLHRQVLPKHLREGVSYRFLATSQNDSVKCSPSLQGKENGQVFCVLICVNLLPLNTQTLILGCKKITSV